MHLDTGNDQAGDIVRIACSPAESHHRAGRKAAHVDRTNLMQSME